MERQAKFAVMVMDENLCITPYYYMAYSPQEAVDKAKKKITPEQEIMEVYKNVKGWKK